MRLFGVTLIAPDKHRLARPPTEIAKACIRLVAESRSLWAAARMT